MSQAAGLIESVRAGCLRWGFDLVQPLRVGWYNAGVATELCLDDFGSGEHLAVLVGNTRALWPIWSAARATDPALATSLNPLDDYTVRALNAVVSGIDRQSSVRFSHEGGTRRVAMQRLAHVAGLAYLTETHASVHPIYGPWIALRAVISFAVAGPAGPAPELGHPCGGCERGCRAAFDRALLSLDGAPSVLNLRANWRVWLAFRDACPTGREHRYSEDQIRYHYLHAAGLGGSSDP